MKLASNSIRARFFTSVTIKSPTYLLHFKSRFVHQSFNRQDDKFKVDLFIKVSIGKMINSVTHFNYYLCFSLYFH